MRKSLFAAGLLAVCFASCKKEQVIVNTEPAKPPFRVAGLADVTIERNPFNNQAVAAFLGLNVRYEYGDQKRVSLSIADLPAGMKDSFSVRSGYPDFNSQVTLYDQGVQAGSYTAKLVAKADGDSTAMNYPFNITVKGDTSCAGFFGGKTYETTNTCSGNIPYSVSSLRPNTASDTLVLNNYRNDGSGLRVLINCRSRQVTVPTQIINNNRIVQGYGQLVNNGSSTPDMVYLSLMEQDTQGNTTNCSYSLRLK